MIPSSIKPSDALAVAPGANSLRLAVAGFLANYQGQTRVHTESDLACFLDWCENRQLPPLEARRVDLERYLRWMQGDRRFRPSTVSRRLSVVAGFYRTCVIDGALRQSPAEYVRRPRVPAGSPTLGLSHLQFEALLSTARDSENPNDPGLVSMLGLMGLRILEATGSDIEGLSEVHGHRVLRVHGKGGKVVLTPLPPAVARAIDRATGNRSSGPILRSRAETRMSRHVATRRLKRLAATAGIEIARMHPHMLRHTSSPRCSTPAWIFATSRSQPGTPTHAPPCDTTGHARTLTATPTTSSPPSWPREPSARGRPVRPILADRPRSPAPRSSTFRRCPLPPVGRCLVTDQARSELNVGKVAELPKLLRGTAVLKDDLFGFEGVKIAGAEPVDRIANTLDKLSQASRVVGRHYLSSCLALRLVRHTSEATNQTGR